MIVMAAGSEKTDVAGFFGSAERAAKLVRDVVEDVSPDRKSVV